MRSNSSNSFIIPFIYVYGGVKFKYLSIKGANTNLLEATNGIDHANSETKGIYHIIGLQDFLIKLKQF